MKSKGFTLIELLVVIAIIGILSSVVLASLNSARDKGNDAAVKSNLSGARAQAELYYDSQTTRTYSGVCTASAANNGISGAITAATNASTGTADCDASATAWAADAPISVSGKYWCVDSTGFSGQRNSTKGATATACPSS